MKKSNVSGFVILIFVLWAIIYGFGVLLSGTVMAWNWSKGGQVSFVFIILGCTGLVCAAYGNQDNE